MQLLQEIHQDLCQLHRAMRLHIRRINKEIFTYIRARKELQTFEAFF